MTDDAKFLKKHIKYESIDVHPNERALVVNYELEATILGELGDPMAGDRKHCQKIVRLKDLNESTDVEALAREVLGRCKLIPSAKLPEVEQLLYYLQNRKDAEGGRPCGEAGTGGSLAPDLWEIGGEVAERASVNSLDDYIEALYEDLPDKVRGTALLLQLARQSDNLEELMHNETLLGALARVLREDWKKSLELSTNIVCIFFCFSVYSQFHAMISHFKVGALCVQIVEYELKRYDLWTEDLKEKTGNVISSKEEEKNLKKFHLLVRKQEQLLRVSLHVLLHLAEDAKTEQKMANRGVVALLTRLVAARRATDLLTLALTFLHKLSLYADNCREMAKQGLVEKIGKMLGTFGDDLRIIAVRLLFNLSFDTQMRAKMSSLGLLNQIVPLVAKPDTEKIALSLLYHLSMDDDCKAMFTYTDCIPLAMRAVLERESYPAEAGAVLVNAALCKRNAQLIAGDDGAGLRLLMQRAFRRRDVLLMKLVGNIADHDGPTKPMLVEFLGDLAEAAKGVGSPSTLDFALECLRVLGRVNLPELDWTEFLNEFQLVAWIRSNLRPDAVEDDVLLELVVLLGTIAADADAADLLFRQSLVPALIALLSSKQEDDEIVLQIVFVFYQMMMHQPVRKVMLNDTRNQFRPEVAAYLIDLMHDKNPEIRKMCDVTLEIVAEESAEWQAKIQEEKFRWHNAQWLEMLSAQRPPTAPDDDDSDACEPAFGAMYGLEAEDILENYENDRDRPMSRLGRNMNRQLSDDENDEELSAATHPLTGIPIPR